MTIADLQRKLNNLLKENPAIDKTSLIVACTVIEPQHKSDIPNGSVIFKCVDRACKNGEWHELQLYPDPPSKLMQ